VSILPPEAKDILPFCLLCL